MARYIDPFSLPTLNALAKSVHIMHVSYIDMECLIKYLTQLYNQQEFSDSNSQIKAKFSEYLIDLASKYNNKLRYSDYSQESLKRLKSTQICNLINHRTNTPQLLRYNDIIRARLSELTEIIEHVETRSIDAKIQHVCDVLNLCSAHDPLAVIKSIAKISLHISFQERSSPESLIATIQHDVISIQETVEAELQKK